MRAFRLAVAALVFALGFNGSLCGQTTNPSSSVQPQAQAVKMSQNFSVLYNFDAKCGKGSPAGHCDPSVQDGPGVRVGAMVQGPPGDDSFYGATPGGGSHNWGTIFKVTLTKDSSGNNTGAETTVLYSFGDAGLKDGRNPSGGLTLGSDGNLYGVTYAGGDKNCGTIFKMTRGSGTPQILYSFRCGTQDPPQKGQPPPPPLTQSQLDDLAAAYPVSPPVLGSDGNVYGVTPSSNPGYGVLYRLGADGTLKCLHRFSMPGAKAFGMAPSSLSQGSDGSLYGITRLGGLGLGTVFQVSPSSAAAGVTTVYSFRAAGSDGSLANGVIQGQDGNLYGTTYSGGPLYRGVVFRLTPTGQYTELHAFGGNASNPVADVVEVPESDPAPSGSSAPPTRNFYLYGASAMNSSRATREDSGILFRLREDGDGKDFAAVYNFDGTNGVYPTVTPVLERGESSLCGITAGGGKFGAGVFYQLPVCMPPTAGIPLSTPGLRVCCAFGYAPTLDPTALGDHKYGNGSALNILGDIPLDWMKRALPANSDVYSYVVSMREWFATLPVTSDIFGWPAKYVGERVGYVYTSNAGLVDFGHVRYTADLTFWIYDQLAAGNKSLGAFADRAWVAKVPTCKEDALRLAAAIAWTYSWGHELSTWGDGGEPREDYSAFSPEDLSSNIVGIESATRAIEAGGNVSVDEFNRQMTSALSSIMTELNAQTDTETEKVIENVKAAQGDALDGKWWMGDPSLTVTRYTSSSWLKLLRRNFDGKAWSVAGQPAGSSPRWLNTTRFSNCYSQFLYMMTQPVDATKVPQSNAYATQEFSGAPARAAGSNGMVWIPIPVGNIGWAGSYVSNGRGMPTVKDASGNLVTTGQFAQTLVNMQGTAGPKLIFATMQKATAEIQRAFDAANPGGMDGP